jgi:DNA-directed RNA polymerase beta' subunit
LRIKIQVLRDDEVEARSFGLVADPAPVCPDRWEKSKRTLFDPCIVGCERDLTCACGKLQGEDSVDRICDLCGVKVGAAATLRLSRFGHILFRHKIPHPFNHGTRIGVIPVIPIAYRSDTGEDDLDFLYSRVLRVNEVDSTSDPNGLERSPDCTDRLADAVCTLFGNESRSQPLTCKGRVVRSLRHYAFENPGTSMEDLGTYLFALMLKVVDDSSQVTAPD